MSRTSFNADLPVVVVTKPAIPGRVKTRLTRGQDAPLSCDQAAGVHRAMTACVLTRLPQALTGQYFIAVDGGELSPEKALPTPCDPAWSVLDQGQGDLGARLETIWDRLGRGPIVFFGVDSPDVPLTALNAIPTALETGDAAVGPVTDGGYWTLAAGRYLPELLRSIDWGTASVYDQTRRAAERAGITLVQLPAWHDVDNPADLAQLRSRLATTREPALARLCGELDTILGAAPSGPTPHPNG